MPQAEIRHVEGSHARDKRRHMQSCIISYDRSFSLHRAYTWLGTQHTSAGVDQCSTILRAPHDWLLMLQLEANELGLRVESWRKLDGMCHEISRHNVDIFAHVDGRRALLIDYTSGWYCRQFLCIHQHFSHRSARRRYWIVWQWLNAMLWWVHGLCEW